ncbi:protein of unknown function [Burkholderia multivorans]
MHRRRAGRGGAVRNRLRFSGGRRAARAAARRGAVSPNLSNESPHLYLALTFAFRQHGPARGSRRRARDVRRRRHIQRVVAGRLPDSNMK